MTSSAPTLPLPRPTGTRLAVAATAVLAVALFLAPARTLVRDWLTDPDASHGLLLFPIAIWLAWRSGLTGPRPARAAALGLLVSAVLLRWVSSLAVELFTMRMSMVLAALGLILWVRGWAQLRRWWLPIALVLLSVPIPDVLLNSLALPLQLRASAWGAALLEWRQVPVLLQGNVIRLPGQTLFVTEACSGLRSLTALVALGLLIGGMWLRSVPGRGVLLLLAIPVAMAVNGIRVFLTGFLVHYVSPALGEGFMHYSEGWALFLIAFGVLGGAAWLIARLEARLAPAGRPA